MNGEGDRSGGKPDQLRSAIDAGQTSDKVPFPDPAAAPLGTDDEAGGAPPRAGAMARAEVRETSRPAPTQAPDRSGPWVWALVLAALLVIAAALAVFYWPAA